MKMLWLHQSRMQAGGLPGLEWHAPSHEASSSQLLTTLKTLQTSKTPPALQDDFSWLYLTEQYEILSLLLETEGEIRKATKPFLLQGLTFVSRHLMRIPGVVLSLSVLCGGLEIPSYYSETKICSI